ncbi:hypothetical protein D3C71_2133560 [compost metagenome]
MAGAVARTAEIAIKRRRVSSMGSTSGWMGQCAQTAEIVFVVRSRFRAGLHRRQNHGIGNIGERKHLAALGKNEGRSLVAA